MGANFLKSTHVTSHHPRHALAGAGRLWRRRLPRQCPKCRGGAFRDELENKTNVVPVFREDDVGFLG